MTETSNLRSGRATSLFGGRWRCGHYAIPSKVPRHARRHHKNIADLKRRALNEVSWYVASCPCCCMHEVWLAACHGVGVPANPSFSVLHAVRGCHNSIEGPKSHFGRFCHHQVRREPGLSSGDQTRPMNRRGDWRGRVPRVMSGGLGAGSSPLRTRKDLDHLHRPLLQNHDVVLQLGYIMLVGTERVMVCDINVQ